MKLHMHDYLKLMSHEIKCYLKSIKPHRELERWFQILFHFIVAQVVENICMKLSIGIRLSVEH